MYKVLVDGALVCDSRIEELALLNPVVELEENKVGSFSFIIPPNHSSYDSIQRRKTIVDVYLDDEDEPVFSGICIEADETFNKQKKIKCEGSLTFLNDSIQRPMHYKGYTVRRLLEAFVANHNAQVEEKKHFQVGIVTVADPNDYITCYTNMESTMKCIKEDLVDDLGGIIRVRFTNGIRYIDYLAESPNTNSQVIKFGKNLMDFTSNIDSSEIATAIIPLGAKLEESTVEGLETRLTIVSVNNGLDYVHSAEAVAEYGWVYKTVEFDDVTTASALKTKGEKYLAETQFENMVIEAKAIDLHLTDSKEERFKISDQIRVVSAPHGLDKFIRLTKQTLNLNKRENDTVTLGKDENVPLSAKTNQVNSDVKKAVENIVPPSNILSDATANATALITAAMGGYVYKTNEELYIMDTNDPNTAQKVWRWNINGLGYSSTGINGKYGLAMTMDGRFVADAIAVDGLEVGKNVRMGADASISWSQISDGTKQATQITKDTVTTSFVNALNVKAGSVDAENITGTTVSGKTISGGTISGTEINNGNGTFTVDSLGNVVANALKSSNANITGGDIQLQGTSNTTPKLKITSQSGAYTNYCAGAIQSYDSSGTLRASLLPAIGTFILYDANGNVASAMDLTTVKSAGGVVASDSVISGDTNGQRCQISPGIMKFFLSDGSTPTYINGALGNMLLTTGDYETSISGTGISTDGNLTVNGTAKFMSEAWGELYKPVLGSSNEVCLHWTGSKLAVYIDETLVGYVSMTS